MTTTTPLGFGVSIWLDLPASEAAELARAAEHAGLTDVWVPDHYFLRDAFVALALMGQATRRVRLGTAVAAVQLRHPALLASSAATVDEVAGHRAVLGLGVGGYEFPTQLGLRAERPLTLMRESVHVVRDLLRGRADRQGRTLTVQDAELGWKARPDLPIYLAARGTKMLQLAGELADGVMVHGLTEPHLDHVARNVAIGAERAGRDPRECEVILLLDVEVDEDEQAATDRLRPRLTVMAGGSYSDELISLYGLDPDDVARLRAAVNAGAPDAHELVTDDMVRVFGLTGDADQIAHRCRQLGAAGVRRVVTFPHGPLDKRLAHIRDLQSVIAKVEE